MPDLMCWIDKQAEWVRKSSLLKMRAAAPWGVLKNFSATIRTLPPADFMPFPSYGWFTRALESAVPPKVEMGRKINQKSCSGELFSFKSAEEALAVSAHTFSRRKLSFYLETAKKFGCARKSFNLHLPSRIEVVERIKKLENVLL
jgi:hypothetical protein